MLEFELHKEKTITSLLYICNRLGGKWDMYSLLKILYFAEMEHLIKYGRPITGDTIVAMENGPVPSFAYDKVKQKSLDKLYFDFDEDNIIVAKTEADLDFLSESEIECLNFSIKDNEHLNFRELKQKSHGKAYEIARKKGGNNPPVSYVDIAIEKGMEDAKVNYISENIQFKHWA